MSQIKTVVENFNKLPKPVRQTILGTSSGWLTGFTLVKFGRYAGFSLGATILILQLGQQFGYIKVDWENLKLDMSKVEAEVKKQAYHHVPAIKDVVKDNAIAATTFLGGLFLGASVA